MKDIYIIGSSGFAKEVYALIEDINAVSKQYNIKGFIDYDPVSNHFSIGDIVMPVFDEKEWLKDFAGNKDIALAVGLGDPLKLSKLWELYKEFAFPNLIHPSAVGHWKTIQMGQGNIITAGVIFTANIIIGSGNIFNLSTTIGHDAKVGSFNVVNPSVNISGGVEIGNSNLIGVGSIILQFKKLGSCSILGAGAVLTKDLGDFKLAVGMPVKVIKELN